MNVETKRQPGGVFLEFFILLFDSKMLKKQSVETIAKQSEKELISNSKHLVNFQAR